jgi:hypothetical protein
MRVPFNQLKAEAELVHRLYGDGPHHGGLSVRKIAATLGRTYGWTWRRWRWYREMQLAHGPFMTRPNRLPLHGRSWDQEAFDRAVGQHEKVKEALAAQEALDREQQVRTDAAGATRNAEKAKRDEAKEWVEAGSSPDRVPAWLIEALKDYRPEELPARYSRIAITIKVCRSVPVSLARSSSRATSSGSSRSVTPTRSFL